MFVKNWAIWGRNRLVLSLDLRVLLWIFVRRKGDPFSLFNIPRPIWFKYLHCRAARFFVAEWFCEKTLFLTCIIFEAARAAGELYPDVGEFMAFELKTLNLTYCVVERWLHYKRVIKSITNFQFPDIVSERKLGVVLRDREKHECACSGLFVHKGTLFCYTHLMVYIDATQDVINGYIVFFSRREPEE